MIWGFIGPEGGGKTTAMTAMALIHYNSGGAIQTFPGYCIHDPTGRALSSPIDFHEWLSMPEQHRNTIFCADEIQNFMDSKLHSSVFSRLVGRVAMQRRKLNMGIFYTVQNWQWLNDRLRWLTHLLTSCYDLRWSRWGKEESLKPGEMIRLTTFDCKGFYTGEPWTLLSRKILHSKDLWPYFDSYNAVDIYEGEKKFEIKRSTQVIDLRPQKEIDEDMVLREAVNRNEADDSQLFEQLAMSGLPAAIIQRIAQKMGHAK